MISKKIPVAKFRFHHHDQANRGHHSSMVSRVAESELKCLTPTPTFPKFPTATPYHKVWSLAAKNFVATTVTLSGNRGAQQEFCFNKSFIRNCADSTGIPNSGMWCKSDPTEVPKSDKISDSTKKPPIPCHSTTLNWNRGSKLCKILKNLDSKTKQVPKFFVSYYCIRFKEVLNLLC